MSGAQLALGADFGTLAGRVVVLDLSDGRQLASVAVPYGSGVIDERLPGTGEQLPPDWALQDPADWTAVLERGVPEALREAGADPGDVVGIGLDVTSCTVLPVLEDGTPLCRQEAWADRPHAWPKLWKHHAAQPVADRLTEVAAERGEPFLARYGGRISSEWHFPKLIEVWLEDRGVYDAAARYLEATDWLVWWLTGTDRPQTCTAGYKAFWSPEAGFPPAAYFSAAYPGFERPEEKLGSGYLPLGSRAGTLRPEVAARLGLPEHVAVAVGNVDSFVSVPGCGVDLPGTFVTVVGTSICDMVLGERELLLPGITGVVRDGILPGLFGYEAGQPAVGDMLGWFVERLSPGLGFAELETAAAAMQPGESGLVALDWWNGNRSVLADAGLSGMIVGLTLQTPPAAVYRALMESIAYGNRRIVENFSDNGLPLERIVACGGIAERSPLLMQLFADAGALPVHVPDVSEIPARGSALFGAVAAGAFADIGEAVAATRPPLARTYRPDPEARRGHDRVYEIYGELHDHFGRERPGLMYRLKEMRARGSQGAEAENTEAR